MPHATRTFCADWKKGHRLLSAGMHSGLMVGMEDKASFRHILLFGGLSVYPFPLPYMHTDALESARCPGGDTGRNVRKGLCAAQQAERIIGNIFYCARKKFRNGSNCGAAVIKTIHQEMESEPSCLLMSFNA